jgi:DNA-binding NarL/FixJ family response regulator
MESGIRVALVDDHPLFVRGLELLLPEVSNGRATVVGTTHDAAAAAGLVRRTVPDLVMVDLHMPAPGGVRAIGAIRRTTPRVRIVAMSGDDDPAPALEALRAGAEGFLPKTSEAADLLHPLVAILDGWAVLPSELTATLLRKLRVSSRTEAAALAGSAGLL